MNKATQNAYNVWSQDKRSMLQECTEKENEED